MTDRSHSNTRMRLKHIKASSLYKELSEKAQSDPKNVDEYVKELRGKLKLSKFWEEILPIVMLHDFNPPLAGAAPIKGEYDQTHQQYYVIEVYPETTIRDVKKAFSTVKNHYESMEKSLHIKDSKRFLLEQQALMLHEQGMSHEEIAKTLDNDKQDVHQYDVPDLINKAKKRRLSPPKQ